MKLDAKRSYLAIALIVFAAEAQGELKLLYEDELTHAVVQVGVGSPATEYTLILDTASANTWVGAEKAYVQSSTSRASGKSVSMSNGMGSFSGQEYSDSLTLSGYVSFTQSIGVASQSNGYSGVDGVLGLGPTVLSEGTVFNTASVPTVPDNLAATGNIDSPTVTIGGGLITFGTPLVEISNIIYADITTTTPASLFWGIDASFAYGSTILGQTTAGIIDHSSSLISLDTTSYRNFIQATGARQDSNTGLLMLNSCVGLSPLVLTFGGQKLNIPVGQYRWPQAQNAAIGGIAGKCYLAIDDNGPVGSGMDFIIGYNTLKHLTVVLDKVDSRVGIASLTIEV